MLDDMIEIPDAEILFRNFEGRQTQYNPLGERNFCVILPKDLVPKLKEAGWNVKLLPGRLEGDDPKEYLQVKVSFKSYAPTIYLIAGNKKTTIDEDTAGMLDWAEIKKADLVIRPYNWKIEDKTGVKTGVKAYLKSLYVVLNQDSFADKYADIPTDSEPQVRADVNTVMEDGV